MQAILKLDVSGQPRGWLTLNEAVTAYARGDVLYGIGGTLPPVFGGVKVVAPKRDAVGRAYRELFHFFSSKRESGFALSREWCSPSLSLLSLSHARS